MGTALKVKEYIKHEVQCFIGISKHREEIWKYDVQRTIFFFFYQMRGVWIPGVTFSGFRYIKG